MCLLGPRLSVLVACLTAACSSDEQSHVYVDVDRSKCSPPCTISRYTITLQRESAGGGRCTFYSNTSAGNELVIPRLDLAAGSQIYVGLAAFCDSPPDLGIDQPVKPDLQPHPSPQCCAAQAGCLQNLSPYNPDCQEARNICPPEGRPDPDPGWKAYHQKYCTGPDAGPTLKPDAVVGDDATCVRCYAISPVTMTPSRKVKSVLQLPTGCDVPELSQPSCP